MSGKLKIQDVGFDANGSPVPAPEPYEPAKTHAPASGPVVVQYADRGDPTKLRVIPYPGKLSIASERGIHGHFGGCAVVGFSGQGELVAEKINRWAEANPWALVVDTKLGPDTTLLFYTRTLTDEEYAQFNEINTEVARAMTERKEVEAKLREENEARVLEAREKLEARAKKADQELQRLAKLGKVHEANCGKRGGE